ncbi:MAG: hypothetical protein ABEL76_05740 [Bradymonadaceae bacterium]
MMITIPARYFWPGLVTALLLGSLGTNAAAIWVAHSAGGPHEVHGSRAARTGDSDRWHARLERTDDRLLVAIRGPQGTPVAGLSGNISPVNSPANVSLRPHPSHRGTYVATFDSSPPSGPFRLRVHDGERSWKTTIGGDGDR